MNSNINFQHPKRKSRVQIIPVVDIKNGVPVHAIAGKRDDYRPIKNSRFDTGSVIGLCAQIISEFEPTYFYIADLDAIEQDCVNYPLLNDLLHLPTHWLFDVGLKTAAELISIQKHLSPAENWSAIFGSESLSSMEQLKRATEKNDVSRIVFSCDFRNGQLIGNQSIADLPIDSLITQIVSFGIRKFILIDLADVGTDQTSLPNLIKKAKLNLTSIELFAGGGVKNQNDLTRFESVGCSGALVATSIHSGEILGKRFIHGHP